MRFVSSQVEKRLLEQSHLDAGGDVDPNVPSSYSHHHRGGGEEDLDAGVLADDGGGNADFAGGDGLFDLSVGSGGAYYVNGMRLGSDALGAAGSRRVSVLRG